MIRGLIGDIEENGLIKPINILKEQPNGSWTFNESPICGLRREGDRVLFYEAEPHGSNAELRRPFDLPVSICVVIGKNEWHEKKKEGGER